MVHKPRPASAVRVELMTPAHLGPTLGAKCNRIEVSVPSQIPRWDSNLGPPDQKSGVQPLEPEKHAQLAEASCNTQSSGTPLLQNFMLEKHYGSG